MSTYIYPFIGNDDKIVLQLLFHVVFDTSGMLSLVFHDEIKRNAVLMEVTTIEVLFEKTEFLKA